MNVVFEQICMDFYLHAIVTDLFINNRAHFKPTIRELASDVFCRLNVAPFEVSDNLIATASNVHINTVIVANRQLNILVCS